MLEAHRLLDDVRAGLDLHPQTVTDALQVLGEPAFGMTYISGPMTGLPELNFPAFHLKAKELRAEGRAVVNPAEIDEAPGRPWHEYMRKDIRLLMDCDTIHMLPGWENSKGARLELHIARELGMKVEGAAS